MEGFGSDMTHGEVHKILGVPQARPVLASSNPLYKSASSPGPGTLQAEQQHIPDFPSQFVRQHDIRVRS